MGLVIDTNVFIDAERGRFDLESLARHAHYGDAYMAAITASELLVGVQLATSTALRLQRAAFAETIIANIPVLDFTREVARTYAEIYAHFLRKRGKPSHNVHDLQIAATAIAHGHTVLTSNRDDFRKIPGLTVATPNAA